MIPSKIIRSITFFLCLFFPALLLAQATYEPDSGVATFPVVGLVNESGTLTGDYYTVKLQTEIGQLNFTLVSAERTSPTLFPDGSISPPDATFDDLHNPSYLTANSIAFLNEVTGVKEYFYGLTLVTNDSQQFLVPSDWQTEPPSYVGDETIFTLQRGGANQFLLPVEIGNQVFNLLVDTGSNALLLFEDKIAQSNTRIRKQNTPLIFTDEKVSKGYASVTREGVLAIAPVRIGAYFDEDMRIMLIQQPNSQNDPSLTSKSADGIIGLRNTEGLNFKADRVLLDVPLAALNPSVNIFELNLPPVGLASLSFGKMPILGRTKSTRLFRSKALSIVDPYDPINRSYSDLQVRFRAKSSYGTADDENLDILLDTGAVSKLILDTNVAKSLGYDSATETWNIPENEEIELNLVGLTETISIQPKFRVSEISVAPYSTLGVEFEAVLGISRWQNYVVGFSSINFQEGGPDGTITLLPRGSLEGIMSVQPIGLTKDYAALAELNSIGDDSFPSGDKTGSTIVFQSNRPGSLGEWDIYVWQKDKGIIDLPNLNTAEDEADPSISADGRYVVFHSNRTGGEGDYDIYLYDLLESQFLATPGLNSSHLERNPHISPDGRYITFRSKRLDGAGGSDVYLYDRQNAQLVELPGLNTLQNEYDPAISNDGLFITFNRAHASNTGDILIYDRKLQQVVFTEENAMGATISSDGELFAFQSNREHVEMGFDGRDVFITYWPANIPIKELGVNSDFEEAAPSFTGDTNLLLFHSKRPGGMGGSDIYAYHQVEEKKTTVSPNPLLQQETIPLTQTTAGLFTLQLAVSGQNINLLVDTTLSAMVIFDDKISPNLINKTSEPVALRVLGEQLDGVLATTDTLGINNLRVVAAHSEDYANIVGHNIEGIDGVIGLYHGRPVDYVISEATVDVPMLTMQPRISMMEFNLDPEQDAGMSIGTMPSIGNVSENLSFNSYVAGNIDEHDPYNLSFTDIHIPFVVSAETKVVGFEPEEEGIQLVLGTTLKENVILDTHVAQQLGYDAASQSWGTVSQIDIYLWPYGSDAFIDVAEGLGVDKVIVADLGKADYQAILGLDYWQQYILGFDAIDYQNGGPMGVVSFMRREDAREKPQTNHDYHFLSLPGLNSNADDSFGDISDDGKTIVFQSNRAGNPDIYVYRLGEGLLDLNWLNSSAMDMEPSISGDGQWIAFQSNRSGYFEIYLYNIATQSLVALPGLNSANAQNMKPTLNVNATQLAFHREEMNENGNGMESNLYLYNVSEHSIQLLGASTNADEYNPSLSNTNLLSFTGSGRYDGQSASADVYLFDLINDEVIRLPEWINSHHYDAGASLSADGNFMAFQSDRNSPNLYQRGDDIFLLETRSQELLYLPNLNSEFTDSSPALSKEAAHILFHSNRTGGLGGYDIYLYQRDDGDEVTYEVTEPYWEDGYVVDAIYGTPLVGITVNVIDSDDNVVTQAVTDDEGDFHIKIPVGTKLPLQVQTADGNGKVVVDEVGDDTYIPDFKAGSLKFSKVWIEDKAESGYTTTIKFDLETDAPLYNILVNVLLIPLKGNASDLNSSNIQNHIADGNAEYFTSIMIEKLGHRGIEGEAEIITIIEESEIEDELTKITYEQGTNNKKIHVEHTFVVPLLAEGSYAVIFSDATLNSPNNENNEQGEETGGVKNPNMAPASILIGSPDKPNLRVLFTELLTNSAELPVSYTQEENAVQTPFLKLNLEIESMAQDTVAPVDVAFKFEIDGISYPLSFLYPDKTGQPQLLQKMTYTEECLPEAEDDKKRCASLFRQKDYGQSYWLYVDEAGLNKLHELQSDTKMELVVTIDPENKISEWENNKSDNVKRLPFMYLVSKNQTRVRTLEKKKKYPSIGFNSKHADKAGNNTFGGGYELGGNLSYRPDDFTAYGISNKIPTAIDSNVWGELWGKVFKEKVTVLGASAGFDLDIDNISGSGGYAKFMVLNSYVAKLEKDTKSTLEKSICNTKCDECKRNCKKQLFFKGIKPNKREDTCLKKCQVGTGTIFSSKDKAGKERWRKEKNLIEKEKIFFVTFVPVSVKAKVTGEIGLRAALKMEENNKIVVEGGPYAELSVTAEAAIGGGFKIKILGYELAKADLRAGVGGKLSLIKMEVLFTPTAQILPSEMAALFRFDAPAKIGLLNGRLYIFATAEGKIDVYVYSKKIKKRGEFELVRWTAIEQSFQTIPPQIKLFSPGKFKYWSYKGCTNGNECATGGTTEGAELTQLKTSGKLQQITDTWTWDKSTGYVELQGLVGFPYQKEFKYKPNQNKAGIDYKKRQLTGVKGAFEYVGEYNFNLDTNGETTVFLYLHNVVKDDDENRKKLFENVRGSKTQSVDIPVGMHKIVIKHSPDKSQASPKLGLSWGIKQ